MCTCFYLHALLCVCCPVWMFLRVRVHVYICVPVCLCTFYAYVFPCVCSYERVPVFHGLVWTCSRVGLYVFMRMCSCVHAFLCVCVHVCTTPLRVRERIGELYLPASRNMLLIGGISYYSCVVWDVKEHLSLIPDDRCLFYYHPSLHSHKWTEKDIKEINHSITVFLCISLSLSPHVLSPL